LLLRMHSSFALRWAGSRNGPAERAGGDSQATVFADWDRGGVVYGAVGDHIERYDDPAGGRQAVGNTTSAGICSDCARCVALLSAREVGCAAAAGLCRGGRFAVRFAGGLAVSRSVASAESEQNTADDVRGECVAGVDGAREAWNLEGRA